MLNVFEFHKHQILIFDISCFFFPFNWTDACESLGIVSRGCFLLVLKEKERKWNTTVSKISLIAIDENSKKDEKDDAASNPNWLPGKVESLYRAPPAVLLGTAYRPASFSWASGELNLTETSSPPRFFREGFVQASAKVRRPFHLDA